MPYNSSTGIINAPLNINTSGDIQQAVNYNSGDLGDCIKNGTINEWAKWKPVRSDKIGPLTFAERQEKSFGLNLTKFTTISDLRAGYSEQWAYLRPRGLANNNNERFRFYDFLNTTISSSGYNKNARCFFNINTSVFPSSYVRGQGNLKFIAQWNPESQLDSSRPGSIKMSELLSDSSNSLSPTLANTYFGILMYSPYWNNIKLKTSGSVIASDDYTAEVSFSDQELENFPSGVTVYPVFAVNSATSIVETFPRSGLIALPMSPFPLDVLSPETLVQFAPTITATFNRREIDLEGKIEITTNVSSTVISGVNYNVYWADSETDKTGAQLGATVSYTETLTVNNYLPVDQPIISTRPAYVRIVITGYLSGDTTITKDYNIPVKWGEIDNSIVQ